MGNLQLFMGVQLGAGEVLDAHEQRHGVEIRGIHERLLGAQSCATVILGIHEQLCSTEVLGIPVPFMGAQLGATVILDIYEQLCAAETRGIHERLLGAQSCAAAILGILEPFMGAQLCAVEIRSIHGRVLAEQSAPLRSRATTSSCAPPHSRASRNRSRAIGESVNTPPGAQRSAAVAPGTGERLCTVEIRSIHERPLEAQSRASVTLGIRE